MDIAGHVFTLTRELGRGNFGVVFEASSRGNPGPAAAAVKISKINKSDGNFSVEEQVRQLLTECTVLYRLGNTLPSHSAARVPKYLAHAVLTSTVNLAMTKAPGQPLDEWLYGTDGSAESAATPEDLLRERLPRGRVGRASSMDFEGACGVVARLLTQLSPVFSSLQDIAFHRDISTHNLLIDDAPCAVGGSPDFNLIDFGLAVEAPEWLQNWRARDIGGDPRYWSPAHWLKLFFGPEMLERDHPAHARIFAERLDHYSFGIVALELLFGLWGPSSEAIAARQSLARARAEWQNYWGHALALRRAVVQHAADLPALHRAAVDTGLCAGLLAAHAALCAALRAAAADGRPGGHEATAVSVLLALGSLIDTSSTVCWESVSETGVQARFSAPRAGPPPREF